MTSITPEETFQIPFILDEDKDQELVSSVKNEDALLPGEITRELITEDEIGKTCADIYLRLVLRLYDEHAGTSLHDS